MSLKKIIDAKGLKEMSVAVFYYASGAIFGPLLLLGGLGYVLDRQFVTSPVFLVGGVFLAFVTTNILLFKKLGKINRLVSSYMNKSTEEGGENKVVGDKPAAPAVAGRQRDK